VQLDVPRLARRPWRAAKVALALLVVLSIALFAAVQAFDTFRDVVTTDDDILPAYADGDDGVEYTSDAGGFTAVFPTDPVEDTEAVPGSDGAQDAPSVSVEVDDVELAVAWFDLGEAPADPASVLSYVSGATESERGGVAEDRGMKPTGPVPVHDFVLRRDDGNDHIRHLLQGGRLYVVRVTGEGRLRPVFNRFADSLELEETA
jgi:hypothetical protein